MVVFDSKIILINYYYNICGKLTIMRASEQMSPSIFARLNRKDLYHIFNIENSSDYYVDVNKPWNVIYSVSKLKDNEEIGFIWVVINHDTNLDITIHGGGWSSSIYRGFFYIDALSTFSKNLKTHFRIIRTSCNSNNIKAKKVIEQSGFVFSEKIDNYCHYIFE